MSALAEAFARDGAVLVKGALTASQVARLAEGIDANLTAPSARAIVASGPDDPGRFVEDFCCWQDNPAYRDILFTSRLGEIAAELMVSRTARLHHDHMLTKLAGTRQATPWHQDQPYYNIVGRQNVSFWIPADPVPRDASLEFVAGSHLGPWLMPRSFMDKQAKWFPEGTLADLPDIDADRQAHDILGWAIEPGTLSPSTCSRCTARRDRRRCGGSFLLGLLATMRAMRCANGKHPRIFLACRRRCPMARRSMGRFSP